LIAYGGAGPVHAIGLAEELGCTTVLVPALAGLFSSLGLLYARPEFHDVHTCHLDARSVEPREVEAIYARLRSGLDGIEFVRSAELRYGGQTWEIEVDVTDPVALPALLARFEDEHERLYGVRGEPGSPIEIRALRLVALGPSNAVEGLSVADSTPRGADMRATHLGEVPVRSRASIGSSPESGALLVDEYDTTVVVRVGWTVWRDEATDTLLLERTT